MESCHPIDRIINKLAAGFSDFLYPQFCLECRVKLNSEIESALCAVCKKNLLEIKSAYPVCFKCGKKLSSDLNVPDYLLICSDCRNLKIFFEQARHIYDYSGVIKNLIKRFKYNQETDNASILCESLIQYISISEYKNIKFDYIVNAPMSDSKIKERGIEHIDILCRDISDKLKINYKKNAVVKIKDTKQQAGLSRKERIQNLKNSFAFNSNQYSLDIFFEKNILFIDDVFSTGATSNECCKVLKKKCKSIKIYVLTIARGM
ncbi:MAG TPA: ComF family protein [bacterium]|nr:ComF family protein [bacterium]HPN29854.1 ComF family protein [bacterium]